MYSISRFNLNNSFIERKIVVFLVVIVTIVSAAIILIRVVLLVRLHVKVHFVVLQAIIVSVSPAFRFRFPPVATESAGKWITLNLQLGDLLKETEKNIETL